VSTGGGGGTATGCTAGSGGGTGSAEAKGVATAAGSNMQTAASVAKRFNMFLCAPLVERTLKIPNDLSRGIMGGPVFQTVNPRITVVAAFLSRKHHGLNGLFPAITIVFPVSFIISLAKETLSAGTFP
jgi:hypothetical protein